MEKQIKTGKVINLADYIRKRELGKNTYVVGRIERYLSDTLVPAYHQIMDVITFIDQMVRLVIKYKANKLYFESNGDIGSCLIFKKGSILRQYPIEQCTPLLNHVKGLFGLDKLKERAPKRWETYKIKTKDGTYLCEAVPQTLSSAFGEDVLINFYDHSGI
jgi:hypothetical protein